MENRIRLKVLISAHEFSPVQGSECSEGWNIVTRLAKLHDVTVLYASGSQFDNMNYAKAIENYIEKNGPIQGLKLINIDQPYLTRIIAGINSNFMKIGSIGFPSFYFLGYKLWQKAALRVAKKLHEVEQYDIAHQLTQITFREPGYFWKLGIPFIWGPTGGTSVLPRKYKSLLSTKSKLLEDIRSISNYFQFRFSYRIKKAIDSAAVIYTFSRNDFINFKSRTSGEVKILLDAGTSEKEVNILSSTNKTGKIYGIWCGSLIERKSLSILLKAIALDHVTMNEMIIIVVGNGPLEKYLKDLAMKLELSNIEWKGSVSYSEVFNLMKQADFFVHTSLREATSNVIPEALSIGLPVVCHDIDGMSIAINEKCGIKIPFNSPEESIIGFNAALKRLILEKGLITNLKQGAFERANELSWDVIVSCISEDYYRISKNKRKLQ